MSSVYKYSNFRNQGIIDNLLKREEQHKKIIYEQAKKHNDNEDINEINKMFSTLVVEKKVNRPLSKYMNKSINSIL